LRLSQSPILHGGIKLFSAKRRCREGEKRLEIRKPADQHLNNAENGVSPHATDGNEDTARVAPTAADASGEEYMHPALRLDSHEAGVVRRARTRRRDLAASQRKEARPLVLCQA